jgi:hypothetical protein
MHSFSDILQPLPNAYNEEFYRNTGTLFHNEDHEKSTLNYPEMPLQCTCDGARQLRKGTQMTPNRRILHPFFVFFTKSNSPLDFASCR